MLEDGDLRLTESSAILRYLAEKLNSPAYPEDLKQRARVNSAMDWINTMFYRDLGYGLIYPQLFPHLKRDDAKQQEGVVAWGKEKSKIGFRSSMAIYLANNEYLRQPVHGRGLFRGRHFTAGELIHCDFRPIRT